MLNKTAEDNDESMSGFGTPSANKETAQSRDNLEQTNSSNNLSAQELNEKLESAMKEQKAEESKPNTCKHVCPRLTEGTCPHGISGKKKAGGKEV